MHWIFWPIIGVVVMVVVTEWRRERVRRARVVRIASSWKPVDSERALYIRGTQLKDKNGRQL